MKKILIFLLVIIFILVVIRYLNDDNDVSYKIQILYKEESNELSKYSNKLFEWRREISNISSNTSCTIERNGTDNWQYYTEDYQRISFIWDDNELNILMNKLFDNYNIRDVIITDSSIQYRISEDALIYSEREVPLDSLTVHIEGNWYHYQFPYGI